MPIQLRYKIGPKKQGNWKTPLEFNIIMAGKDSDLKFRPQFTCNLVYDLPDKIFLGNQETEKKGNYYCKIVEKIACTIDSYFEENYEYHIRASFATIASGQAPCRESCSHCKAYLPWRPGKPDYSDFEDIFQQFAQDLSEVWKKAVAETKASEATKEKICYLSSDDLIPAPIPQTEEKKTVKRKVKI